MLEVTRIGKGTRVALSYHTCGACVASCDFAR